ncbi:MAG TPA: hypothetical protein VGU45_02790 [Microvirga sp.]|jgi:transcriptional regulator with XRE-family HTH domain|nr:hypothetical protein [Microvirga sp.]
MTERAPRRTHAPPEGQRADFAEKLAAAIRSKGWSLAETARQVSQRLPEGERFNPVNLTHYLQGRSQPRARFREALLAVLDLQDDREAAEFQPELSSPDPAAKQGSGQTSRGQNDLIRIEDLGDGTVRLSIEVVTSWPKAIALLEQLKVHHE